MKIIVAKTSGFCHGVNYTIEKAKEALNNYNKVYSLGDIVHNEYVIDNLKDKGLIVVNDISDVEDGCNLIIRAHGESLETYEKAKLKKINVIDLTCGKVGAIHKIIEREKDKSLIVIIGKKSHPETIAHLSYADKACVIETFADLENLLDEIKNTKIKRIYVVAQTTFNDLLFEKIVNLMKIQCKNVEIVINKTICNATKLRQNETRELAKIVDKMIIIGGVNSSNTKELSEVAKENCSNVFLIQKVNDLSKIKFMESDIVGISAGASTPNELIYDVKNYLNSLYKIE